MATRSFHPEQPCSDEVLLNGIRIAGAPGRVTLRSETYDVVGDHGRTYPVTFSDGGRTARCPVCPATVMCKHIVAAADYRARHGARTWPSAA